MFVPKPNQTLSSTASGKAIITKGTDNLCYPTNMSYWICVLLDICVKFTGICNNTNIHMHI